ncbi:MAG: class I SAM-dependent methyltransferase [Bacillota bacterium]|nr:class I SAM-dependent methyltransferase [Bacillota bacterium]
MAGGMALRLKERFFDELASAWDSLAAPPAPDLLHRLLSVLRIREGDRVLDVGSGTGSLIPHLAGFGPAEIIACDLSREMLKRSAAKHSRLAAVTFLRTDARRLPLPDATVDAIVCNGVYPHFEDRRGTLEELHRVAAPGARLAICHFGGRAFVNRIHSSSPCTAIRNDLLEPAAEVADLVRAAGFEVTEAWETENFYLVAGVKNHG